MPAELGPLLVGIAVSTYATTLGAGAYYVRQSRKERERAAKRTSKAISRNRREIRRINQRGTFGSRTGASLMAKQLESLAPNVSTLINNLGRLSVEVEAQQVDISDLAKRIDRIEERQMGGRV